MSKRPNKRTERPNPHGYQHKLVNGELVELTPDEINELLDRDEAQAKESDNADSRAER